MEINKEIAVDKKNLSTVECGRLGGKIGGVMRAKKLTAERRREIARMGALARWEKVKNKNKITT